MVRMHKSPLTSLLVVPALSLVVAVGCAPIDSSSNSSVSDSTVSSTVSTEASGEVPSPNSSVPKGSQSASSSNVETLALSVLEGIAQHNEVGNGYVRDLFRHWTDADGDGCNTREEVLIAESLSSAQVDAYGCTVVAGDWLSLFDGRAHTDPSDLDIDHLIPLKEAWDSGAYSWSSTQREQFANDLTDGRVLIAVTSGVNRSKGDRDPSQWLPPSSAYICTYISDWIAVKYQWGLNMDSSEWGRIKNLLNGQCAGTTISAWATASMPATPALPAIPTSPPSTGVEPSTQADPELPTIRPGAYCTPEGALGTYSARTYLCAKTKTTGEPYSDGRARWRRQ